MHSAQRPSCTGAVDCANVQRRHCAGSSASSSSSPLARPQAPGRRNVIMGGISAQSGMLLGNAQLVGKERVQAKQKQAIAAVWGGTAAAAVWGGAAAAAAAGWGGVAAAAAAVWGGSSMTQGWPQWPPVERSGNGSLI